VTCEGDDGEEAVLKITRENFHSAVAEHDEKLTDTLYDLLAEGVAFCDQRRDVLRLCRGFALQVMQKERKNQKSMGEDLALYRRQLRRDRLNEPPERDSSPLASEHDHGKTQNRLSAVASKKFDGWKLEFKTLVGHDVEQAADDF